MCWLEFVMRWIEAVYETPVEADGVEEEQAPPDAPLPDIPPMFRAEPAVLEAELIVQGKSTSRAIPGRVVR